MYSPELSNNKQTWRSWAKERRSGLQSEIALKIIQHLKNAKVYQNAQHILSYLAFGTEFTLESLHKDTSKMFYTTRTHDKPEPHLSIHALNNDLERHPFGYYQPKKDAPIIPTKCIDLVLVPGLAFDRTGSRLGYGMGYYDRLLSLMPEALKVAITTESLLVPELPQEAFDIKMTHIATEKGITEINSQINSQR